MSKAREIADLLDSSGKVTADDLDIGQVGGRRNLIINGAMQVAQRGTSNGPNTTTGILSLDRWHVNSSGGTKTVSQESFTSGQTEVPDFPRYYMRLAVTTGNNNLGVHQRIEDVRTLGGKTVTVSFWAKGTNPAGGSFVSSWIQNFGSSGSTFVETEAKSGIVLTSSWQKFTFTFDVPSISGKTIGASSFTWVEVLRQPALDTGTAGWTADIAQVQVEVGTVATPFEHRSYGEELALCQRYYEILDCSSSFVMNISSSHTGRQRIPFQVEKRADPTLSFGFSSVSNFQYYGNNCSGVSGSANKRYAAMSYSGFNGWNPAAGGCVYVSITNTGSKDIYVDAEL